MLEKSYVKSCWVGVCHPGWWEIAKAPEALKPGRDVKGPHPLLCPRGALPLTPPILSPKEVKWSRHEDE